MHIVYQTNDREIYNKELDISFLPQGQYFLRIVSNKNVEVKKIIKM